MSLSRRLSTILLTMFAVAAALVVGAQPAVSQALGGSAPQALRGQEITFTSPQFVVHALWFKANDETGWYWQGSDEVYAVFSDMDPTHGARITATYDNVDEGDTETFRSADRCMAPQPNCDRGTSSLNVRFSFWELDGPLPAGLEFCPGWLPGSNYPLENGKCPSDDFIGHGAIIYSQAELLAMLPAVGDSREFTAVMDKNAGKYRFRYRISRLANTDRTLVIHLPPDLGTTPTITLQARPDADRVRLAWSGATSTSVDIFRNGVKLTTTANDGAHIDLNVAPGTYQYRVCNLGSATACSPQVAVTVT